MSVNDGSRATTSRRKLQSKNAAGVLIDFPPAQAMSWQKKTNLSDEASTLACYSLVDSFFQTLLIASRIFSILEIFADNFADT